MSTSSRIACLVLAAACWRCDSAPGIVSLPQAAVPVGPGDGILFVGNSLTLANDLPGMVQGLVAAAGDKLLTATVAYGGYNLDDHLRQGDAVRSIATRGWRAVVLQQGPSTLPERPPAAARMDGQVRPADPRRRGAHRSLLRLARLHHGLAIPAAAAAVLQEAAAEAVGANANP